MLIIRKILLPIILVLIFLLITGIVNRTFSDEIFNQKIKVEFTGSQGQTFITKADIQKIIKNHKDEFSPFKKNWNLNALENLLEKNPYIKEAQVFRNVKKDIMIKVLTREPIARCLNRRGEDLYIDKQGFMFPMGQNYTARVLVVEFPNFKWKKNLNETPFGKSLFFLLQYINDNTFWKYQIVHLFIRPDSQIEMMTQLSQQKIEFGFIENIEVKFKKLQIVYKDIFPSKGWNQYKSINLKYKNQIILKK